jgi:hypothetical protein
MARTKIESKIVAERAAGLPDATDLKFPPDGLFTGVQIARILGIHEDTVRKRYYPEALEIYQVCCDRLKQGQFYTQLAFDEFFRMRQTRDKDCLILNSSGTIVRHADGQPVTEPNGDRATKRAYRALRWCEQPELQPGYQPDSIEAAGEDGLAIVPTTYDAELVDEFNHSLDAIESIGDGMGNFLAAIEASGEQMADAVTNLYTKAFTQRLNTNMSAFQESVGKSMSHKR